MNIEKNIPVPSAKSFREKYPFKHMDVGDSVLIPAGARWKAAANAAWMVGYRDGKKFTSRSTPEGMRIWRIE